MARNSANGSLCRPGEISREPVAPQLTTAMPSPRCLAGSLVLGRVFQTEVRPDSRSEGLFGPWQAIAGQYKSYHPPTHPGDPTCPIGRRGVHSGLAQKCRPQGSGPESASRAAAKGRAPSCSWGSPGPGLAWSCTRPSRFLLGSS